MFMNANDAQCWWIFGRSNEQWSTANGDKDRLGYIASTDIRSVGSNWINFVVHVLCVLHGKIQINGEKFVSTGNDVRVCRRMVHIKSRFLFYHFHSVTHFDLQWICGYLVLSNAVCFYYFRFFSLFLFVYRRLSPSLSIYRRLSPNCRPYPSIAVVLHLPPFTTVLRRPTPSTTVHHRPSPSSSISLILSYSIALSFARINYV